MPEEPATPSVADNDPTETHLDPAKLVVTYVGALSVSTDVPNRMVLTTLLSGVPLPTKPNQYEQQLTVAGVYAFNMKHAKFLRGQLNEFIDRVERENGGADETEEPNDN